MKIIKVDKQENIKNSHGISAKKMYDTDFAQVMHLTLKPGESLKPHITPVDVFFYILEGRGYVEIGNECKDVNADCLIDSPANIPHCLYNKSDEIFRVLVVKVPKPTKPTKILKKA